MDPRLQVQFSSSLRRSDRWFRVAEELLSAAQLLEPQIEMFWRWCRLEDDERAETSQPFDALDPYFLLVAYAIENFCKGAIVRSKAHEWRNKNFSKLPKELEGHDLVKLLDSISFPHSSGDEVLLERLTRSSIWAARYPVPVKPHAIANTKKLQDGSVQLLAFNQGSDVPDLKNLVDRLKSHVGAPSAA